MHSPDLRRSFGGLFTEQVRIVGLALTREAMLAGAALALICILSLVMAVRYDEELYLSPDLLQPTLMVALWLPYAVWKGDPIFGRAFLWTLPVRRQHAAAAKVLAGALLMMVAMLVTWAALGLTAVMSGGGIGVEQVRLLDTGGGLASATKLHWQTPPWAWAMPFGAALILYLASSAALLGLRHPIRWILGTIVGTTLLIVLTLSLAPDDAIEHLLQQVHDVLWSGPLGFDHVLTGGETSLSTVVDPPGKGVVLLWSGMPGIANWAVATLIWLMAALLALALAIRRHWER
jgi:hypothetical protein